MMSKNILETVVVIIGSLGKERRSIYCKLGQDIGKIVITEAIMDSGGLDEENSKEKEVIVGERNNWMNGINDSSTSRKLRVVRFGSKGSLIV